MRIGSIIVSTVALGIALPARAQDYHDLHRAADAAIASDIARDRQAERDEKRQPYASPEHGPIHSLAAARDACAAKARQEVGAGARIMGRVEARIMSTGWEVEGEVGKAGDQQRVPFICSVRNGSVSSIVLDPSR